MGDIQRGNSGSRALLVPLPTNTIDQEQVVVQVALKPAGTRLVSVWAWLPCRQLSSGLWHLSRPRPAAVDAAPAVGPAHPPQGGGRSVPDAL